MARWRRVALWSVLGVVAVLLIAITMTVGWRPFIGPAARAVTDRTFESTPERLERGRYLFTALNGCVDCHSEKDRTADGHPAKAGTEGAGRVWVEDGLPWMTASNITPDKETGVGAWTDDELARAIREGVSRDGRALFPIMPYTLYKDMADEDLASVIVYLRTLKPIRNQLPKTEIPFPPGPLINTVPQPVTAPVPPPDATSPDTRGEYLVQMAACTECHTPMDDRGGRLPGMAFAGGNVFTDGTSEVASLNITPDPSGISYYSEDLFVSAMRTGRVVARELHDVMPWIVYRNLSDEDLRAMFAYLRTVKPVKHSIDNTVPPTLCPLCGAVHGKGEVNQATN
jgi:hypothetical protein